MTNKILHYITLLPFLWAFTGIFAYDSDKHFVVICVVAFIAFLIQDKGRSIKKERFKNPFIFILIILSIVGIITKITVGQSTSILRVTLAILITSFTLNSETLSFFRKNLHWFIFSSSLISFSYIVYQSVFLNLVRTSWSINPIPYTTMVAAVTSISLYYVLLSKNTHIRLLSGVGFILGISGIIISETRGSLLSVIIISLVLLSAKLIIESNKTKTLMLILLSLVVSTFISLINIDKIKHRYEQTQVEVEQILHGYYASSVGLRIQMWKAGLELSKTPKLLGLGDSHIDKKLELADKGIISKEIIRYSHYHNDYISSLVKRGIVGLTLLLLLLTYPLYFFFKHRNEKTSIAAIISVTYIIGSFTDIPLSQSTSLVFYLIMMSILCSNPSQFGGTYENSRSC